MGSGRFDAKAYASFSSAHVQHTTDKIYSTGVGTSSRPTYDSIHKDLDPKNIKIRESRDSLDNPESTPLIVALDVTGSMGMIADIIARDGLGILFNGIFDRKPITDPHIMFMGIGDANCDRAPLQVSQFEADNRIIEQLTQLYLEHGGGGNAFESYNFAWWFAAFKTIHDAYEKRGRRGYLFTVGDECFPEDLTVDQIKMFTNETPQDVPNTQELLRLAQQKYNVFHIIIEEGSHARAAYKKVHSSWIEHLGQNVISLSDHKKLAETIVAAIEVAEGNEAKAAAEAWKDTEGTIYSAIKNIPRGPSRPLLGGPA